MSMTTHDLQVGVASAVRARNARQRRSRDFFLGAAVALVLVFGIVGVELVVKEAFVNGFTIIMLLIAAATFGITGALARSE
jgi:cobalamin biosynthesis protein CobD/CbiB